MMIKRITINTLAILIIAISATSCTEKLDVEVSGDNSNELVIYGSITTDTTAHKVKLSRTIPVNAKNTIYESNAHVSITDGSKVFELTESEPGIYLTDSNVYGEIGKTYTLNVVLDNGEEYSATSDLNSVSEIDSAIMKKVDADLAGINYIVYFNGLEPAGEGNHYMWNLYFNDTIYNSLDETFFETDEFVDGEYVYDLDLYWIEEDEFEWDTVHYELEMVSIPGEYYEYLYEVMSETAWRGGPYDPVPANVSTNISGDKDASGFFYAAAITRKDSIFIESQAETVPY